MMILTSNTYTVGTLLFSTWALAFFINYIYSIVKIVSNK